MNKLNEIFGIDLRSLALFRFCLGLILLFDLATRLPDLNAFYTDEGVLPRAALLGRMPNPWAISIHLMNGTALVQTVLLGIQGVCAIGLLIGYRTRWMAVLSWFLMASLHRRNHMVVGGGDDYFRLLLFWSMFLPMGARFSIDSFLNPARQKLPARIFSWATAAILLQIAVGYLMAAYHKWDLSVWREGTAIYYALNVDNYAKDFAQILLQFPPFLKILTYTVLWLELFGPLLLFCPVWTGPVRTLTVFGFMFMHLGFYLSMSLMLFPWVSAAAMLVFLPSWFWDRSARPVEVRSSRSTNICAVLFLICIVLWNLEAVKPLQYKMPETVRSLCQLAHLDQAWRMFAPPPPTGGWFVVPGNLKDGTQVDLFRQGAPVSWIKPLPQAMFKNERWRRYMFNFVFGKNKNLWPGYGRFLCQSWNAGHAGQQQMESLAIVFMGRKTPPPGQTGEYKKMVLLKYNCSGSPGQGTRPPAFAGRFYPVDAATLGRTVDQFITSADAAALPGKLVALLVPHAGYAYSGTVAGYGYRQIGKDWTTVILLGPSHHVPIQGAAIWARGAFSTPLGQVAVDEALAHKLLASSGLIHDSALPHLKEHSLEVQLPFLQRRLGNFKIVPMLISTTDLNICRKVGTAIAQAVKGQKALILISSDLSHYPDRDTARLIDRTTLRTLEQMDLDVIHQTAGRLMKRNEKALKTTMCGQGALLAGLRAAQLLGSDQALVLHYANSGESDRGDPNRVVGYAAVAFLAGTAQAHGQQELLDANTRTYLLAQASRSIQDGLEGVPEHLLPLSENPALNLPTGVFVTLKINGRLRGCRGSISPSRTLLAQVIHFAREAAFNDPRFPPLTKEEFGVLRIKISVLSPLEKVLSADQIMPGKHGVTVRKDQHNGLLLPTVWKKLPDKERFLATLCVQKAGLSNQCWKDPQATLNVFTTTDLEN